MPEQYKYAFVCGLLDSDGCVRYGNGGSTLTVEWFGHESYMYWIQSMIPKSKLRVRKYDGLICVGLYRQEDVFTYSSMMYSESPLHLNRKYERFIQHFKNRVP